MHFWPYYFSRSLGPRDTGPAPLPEDGPRCVAPDESDRSVEGTGPGCTVTVNGVWLVGVLWPILLKWDKEQSLLVSQTQVDWYWESRVFLCDTTRSELESRDSVLEDYLLSPRHFSGVERRVPTSPRGIRSSHPTKHQEQVTTFKIYVVIPCRQRESDRPYLRLRPSRVSTRWKPVEGPRSPTLLFLKPGPWSRYARSTPTCATVTWCTHTIRLYTFIFINISEWSTLIEFYTEDEVYIRIPLKSKLSTFQQSLFT